MIKPSFSTKILLKKAYNNSIFFKEKSFIVSNLGMCHVTIC